MGAVWGGLAGVKGKWLKDLFPGW